MIAWWFAKGNLAVGLLLFAFLTIPLLLWARAKSAKIDRSEGTNK